jgi:hypothetical protein
MEWKEWNSVYYAMLKDTKDGTCEIRGTVPPGAISTAHCAALDQLPGMVFFCLYKIFKLIKKVCPPYSDLSLSTHWYIALELYLVLRVAHQDDFDLESSAHAADGFEFWSPTYTDSPYVPPSFLRVPSNQSQKRTFCKSKHLSLGTNM